MLHIAKSALVERNLYTGKSNSPFVDEVIGVSETHVGVLGSALEDVADVYRELCRSELRMKRESIEQAYSDQGKRWGGRRSSRS